MSAKPWFRVGLVLCVGAALAACISYPEVTRDTPYEGNVSPLDYRPVSGAPVSRSASAEAMQIVAGGMLGGPHVATATAASQIAQPPPPSGLGECGMAGEPTK